MQFVLTKHTWQVVEVYHILITEVYDIDDLRIFMRQAAENLVNIGRFTIDGINLQCNRHRQRLLHLDRFRSYHLSGTYRTE